MPSEAREPTLAVGAIKSPTRTSGIGDDRIILAAVLILEAALLSWGLRSQSLWLAAASALGGLFFLVAYRWPNAGTALIFCVAPLSFQAALFGRSFVAIPTEPMMLLALAGRALRAIVGGSPRVGRLPLIAPLAAYGAATLLSCFAGEHVSLSLKAWLVLAGYASFGYVAFVHCDVSPEPRVRWLRIAATVAAVVAAYGVFRIFMEGVSTRSGYGIGRPFFAEHGTYSAYLAIFAPWLMLETLDRRGRTRAAYASAFGLVLAAVILSFTRAAWLSLLIVLPATLFAWSIRKRSVRSLAAASAWAAVLALIIIATGLGDRLSRHALTVVDTQNVSNLERVNRWMAGWQMAQADPWTGVGYDAFGASYSEYRRKVILTDQSYMRMGPHSEPLRALSETGLLGLLAGVWLVWAVGHAGWRSFRRSEDPDLSRLALGMTAGLGTYFVHGWLNAYPGSDKMGLVIWMAIGAVAAISHATESGRHSKPLTT